MEARHGTVELETGYRFESVIVAFLLLLESNAPLQVTTGKNLSAS